MTRPKGAIEPGGRANWAEGGGMVFFSFPSSSRKERSLLQPHYLWSGRGRAAAEDWKVGEEEEVGVRPRKVGAR